MTALRHLKDRESKLIIKEFIAKYPAANDLLNRAEHVEELVIENVSVYFVDGKPLLLHTPRGFFPSLKFDAILDSLPKIVVDMGAIPHVANGAQIMRPGIRKIEGKFFKDDLVVVLDEKYQKRLALGIAEVDSEAMQNATKGRVISNIHYVGDPAWNSFSQAK